MKKKPVTDGEKTLEAMNKIRNDWGDIKPYTRIIPDKRKKKPKYKESWKDEE